MSTGYTGKAAQILDAAENRIRAGGFNAFSFRDVAADVGIKSASVHYHFPQKADLGKAVVERYTAAFLASLGAPDDPAHTPARRIAHLATAYRISTIDRGAICLCCVLGSEAADLPADVADALRRFFRQLLAWTQTALQTPGGHAAPGLSEDAARLGANQAVSMLQGAMFLSILLKEPAHFEDAATRLLALDFVKG